MQCGPGGYPVNFGLRYCNRFIEATPAYSPEVINLEKSVKGLAMYDLNIQGRVWVEKVRICLMKKLLSAFQAVRPDELRDW